MATSTSSGAEVQRPLATVLIGGLVSTTLLTLLTLLMLFVLPTVHLWIERRRTPSSGPLVARAAADYDLQPEGPTGTHAMKE